MFGVVDKLTLGAARASRSDIVANKPKIESATAQDVAKYILRNTIRPL